MISVIIPALNEKKTICSCLRSLADQTLDRRNYEVIVVDGGSCDGTATLASELADVVVRQKSLGIGGARRDGAKIASGEILAFTDADTTVSPEWLEAVKRNTDWWDCSTGPVVYTGNDIRVEMLVRWRDLYRLFHALKFYYLIGSNMAVGKRVYWGAGGHSDISLLDDYDLSLRLYRYGARGTFGEDQVVYTSPRRVSRLMTYAITVAYGHYHYSISKERQKLLRYPRPEEMTLGNLLREGMNAARHRLPSPFLGDGGDGSERP